MSSPVIETPGLGSEIRRLEFIDSTPLLGNGPALQGRAQAEGYLFFRKLLPAETILAVRRDLLAVVDSFGWRQPDQDPLSSAIDVDALNRVADEDMREDIGVSHACYNRVQQLRSVHRLPHHPRLLSLYRDLFSKEVLVHPRHIVRMISPHRVMVPTPPHQDFPLIQGTSQTWTAWIPMGSCPRTMGGLTVLRKSHVHGYIPVVAAKGAGNIATPLCPNEVEWVEGDYEAGDVLTFPSFTIHRGLRCQHKNQMRLSLDVRFQPMDQVIEEKSLLPHCPLNWEEIYAGWPDSELKYYWRRQVQSLSQWNETLMQPGRRIC